MHHSRPHVNHGIVTAAIALAVTALASAILRPRDPNLELAAAAHHAIESADRAKRESDTAHLAPARWRLLSIALGTTAPLVVATIALAVVTRSRPSDLDVLTAMADLCDSLPPGQPSLDGRCRQRRKMRRIVGRKP